VGTIKTSLKKAVEDIGMKDGKAPWTGCLAAVLWAYRCTAHSTTRVSPAFLVFGSNIRLPLDVGDDSTVIPDSTELHRELVARRLRFISDMIPGLRAEKCEPAKVPTRMASMLATGYGFAKPSTMAKNYARLSPPAGRAPFRCGKPGTKAFTESDPILSYRKEDPWTHPQPC